MWNAPKLCKICNEYEEQVLLSYVSPYINIEQVERDYQSKLITQQGIVMMCENCGQVTRLNNLWEEVNGLDHFCLLVGDKCFYPYEHHTHNICSNCLEK